jgi:hypothetical protein
VVVDKCGSYNSAVERVISSDIASQQQATKPEADDIDTELIHTGKKPSYFLFCLHSQKKFLRSKNLFGAITRIGDISVLGVKCHSADIPWVTTTHGFHT